jgi:hypothetical protein
VELSSLPSDTVALNGLIPTEDVVIPVLNPLASQADNALNSLNDNFAAFFAGFFPAL